jgi:hypothetical protein
VIVESPSQPFTEKKSKGKVASPVVGTPAQQATAAQAQQSGDGLGVPGVGIYTLGQLDMIRRSTITAAPRTADFSHLTAVKAARISAHVRDIAHLGSR